MATYGTKYYGVYDLPDGGSVRVSIQQKDYSGNSYRIAHMTGLSLEIGGGNDPVYAPIVKTTLRFSMRDVFNVGDSNAITPDGDKHGKWEEFYTNDATKYKVLLYFEPDDASAPSRPSLIWSGYMTPDNWQEDLYYRGNINITARDMLGTLSDLDFDDAGTNGRITVQTLIQHAITKCQATMGVLFSSPFANYYLRHGGSATSILESYISVEAFKGRTWWDALSDTLEGLGLVLRYNGMNNFAVASLRYLPNILIQEQHGCAFINHSGVRQLDPPIRDVSGEFRAEIQEKAITPLNSSDLVSFGSVTTVYPDRTTYYQGTANAYELQQRSGDWGAGAGSENRPPLFVAPLPAYRGLISISEHPYFICNTGKKLLIGAQKNYGIAKVALGVLTAPCKLIIKQAGDIVSITGTVNPEFFIPQALDDTVLQEVLVYIKNSDGKYFRGGDTWSTGTEKNSDKDTTSGAIDPLRLTFENGSASIDIFPPSSDPVRTNIEVNIVYVGVDHYSFSIDPALYVPLRVCMGENSSSDLADEYVVKTVRNEDYNVRISRTPAIGSIDTQLPGRLFNNVLLDANGNPLSNGWEFAGMGGAEGGYPLEVMVQAQILQLYAASLSILSGTFCDKNYDWAVPGTGYLYFNRPCLLLRGTFDFTTGYVRDAALREYLTWTEVWGSTFAPQYTVRDERTGGSGGSGGSGGGYPSGGGSGSNVEWAGNPSDNYEKLVVNGDQNHTVALSGHHHVIADVTDLAALIPSQASSENQLADKNFVNSSIATATATFRGTSAAGLTENQFLTWAYGLPAYDQNDYIFWNTVDSDGNVQFKRYKFSGASWVYEYTLNNSSFTAAQWAAINSGITSQVITNIWNSIANKQNVLTWDDEPRQNSNNPVRSGGLWTTVQNLLTLIGQKATAAWGAITNNKAPLTVNDVSRTVLLDGWIPGTAGDKGTPVFAAPRTEDETYKYKRGSSGNLEDVTTAVTKGQPRIVNHIGTHPELTNPVVIPGLMNDLAYFIARGGSCKIYVNNTERTDVRYAYDKGAMFNLAPSSMAFLGSNTYEGTTYYRYLTSPDDVVKLVLNPTGMTDIRESLGTFNQQVRYSTRYNWASILAIDFGNDHWGPTQVKVTVKYGYYTISSATGTITITEDTDNRERFQFDGQTVSDVKQHLDFVTVKLNSNSSYGIVGIEIEMTGFNREGDTYCKPRISEIMLINLNSDGAVTTFMSRFRDDAVFRSITPAMTNTYDLGSSASRWNQVHAKRVYLSSTVYLEVDAYGKAHLYGATGLVVENGDVASAGAPQS